MLDRLAAFYLGHLDSMTTAEAIVYTMAHLADREQRNRYRAAVADESRSYVLYESAYALARIELSRAQRRPRATVLPPRADPRPPPVELAEDRPPVSAPYSEIRVRDGGSLSLLPYWQQTKKGNSK